MPPLLARRAVIRPTRRTVSQMDHLAGRQRAVRGLLSDGLLEGQHEVSTVLRPARVARPIPSGDSAAVLEEILWLCQIWGGAGQPILPVSGGSMPTAYRRLLDAEQIDAVGGRRDVSVELPFRVETAAREEFPALLIAAHESRERWRPVEVCELDADDPWRAIYAAVLGVLPEKPDPELSERQFVRQDLAFDEIVPIQRVAVRGSLDDLVARTVNRNVLTPRQFANIFLAYGLAPDTSFFGHDQPIIPVPRATRRAAGPNLIVAMTSGSVEDVALLWNLRAAHGDRRVLPIGVPADQVTPQVLRMLQQPGRATMFGLGGGSCYLVSSSIALDKLQELAALSPAVRATSYEDILTFGPAPGRPRSHVSIWNEGRTRLDPLSESDRDVLREARGGLRSIPLTLDVQVDGLPLPTDPTMRGTELWGRFQAGSAQVAVSELRRQQTVEVMWPSSWTCLAAVAQTRRLVARESAAGLAAATLVRSIGDTTQIRWLGHHGLITLLYRMAERSGMAWWKRRWAEAQRALREQGADAVTVDEIAEMLGRDDPAVAPPGEGRAVAFQEFVNTLGSEVAARHWVAWAERRHLLVRGANIRCPACAASAWLPMAAIPPPVVCAACGREILHPYGPKQLSFTYRLGEALRRVLETDSLGHVLALRWFVELFDRRGLVGAHPGVDFIDPETKAVIGEADVLLLFVDGSLVPVEVKRRSAGFDERAQRAMNTVADALRAPWDVLVATEPARDCEPIRGAERRLPDRPRLLLTTDQLFQDHVYWGMGEDPFEWDPRSQEQDAARDAALAEWLRNNDPDQPWNRVSDTLLDQTLGARHTRVKVTDEAVNDQPDGPGTSS